MKGSDLIEAIENFYRFENLGPVLKWADKTHNNAWSDAMMRLDETLGKVMANPKDPDGEKILGQAFQSYMDAVMPLLSRYRQAHRSKDKADFLKRLEENTPEPEFFR